MPLASLSRIDYVAGAVCPEECCALVVYYRGIEVLWEALAALRDTDVTRAILSRVKRTRW